MELSVCQCASVSVEYGVVVVERLPSGSFFAVVMTSNIPISCGSGPAMVFIVDGVVAVVATRLFAIMDDVVFRDNK